MQANALATEVANSSTAATTLNELVVFATVSGASVATTPTTTPTQGVEGICVASCGVSGTYSVAQIAREGVASCAFDGGGATAGDYVQASSTVGKCADAGSAYPTNGYQVLGRVLATHAGAGNVSMVLYPPGMGVSSFSAGSGVTATFNNAMILDAASGTPTLTFQGSDTYVGRATTDTLTNKTFDTAHNTFDISGTAMTITGNTAIVATAESGTRTGGDMASWDSSGAM